MVAVERAHQESSNPPRPHASPTHAMRDAARSPGAAVGDDQRFRFSDVETASSTGAAVCSSLSSGSSAGSLPRSSSLSHPSLDCGYPSAAAASTAAVDSTNLSSVVALPRCSSLSALSSDVAPSVRPHRSGDAAWAAIRAAASDAAPLGPKDFALVRRIGAGDIGTVYLCRLRTGASASNPPPCVHYAMKVVDRNAVAKKKKLERAAAERRILRALDHPFLPTLFADFDAAPHFSCVVMEFCPGGDLHSLRHRLPSRRFPLPSARFYAAEVLLALEYLHMLGIVYRDLKPENVLIRADGHIMLTDFDLSLESTSSPSLVNDDDTARASCFPAHLLRFNRRRSRRQPRKKGAAAAQRFVAEPVDARSHSFVGTHEYVAPEVARGAAHGAAVDWGAYGVFLYELLYGRTPFVGADTESTLRNIAQRPLAYPRESGSGDDAKARDLIGGLLAKDPAERLGSRRGAADVKAHAFFKGINFALLRSARPPVVPAPGVRRSQSCHAAPGSMTTTTAKRSSKDARFDLF